MSILKNLFLGMGAVALAGVLLTMVAPKAVHAAVAALVEVANTSANPVPNADVNEPGEEPFQTQLCGLVGTATCLQPTTFVVPTATSDGLTIKRLVINNVGVSCVKSTTGVSGLTPVLQTIMNENQVNGFAYFGNIIFPLTASPGALDASFVSSVATRAYADPGTTVTAQVLAVFGISSGAGAACDFAINGYFVTH